MVIAIINQKGGVGKTTVAVNLSYCLAQGGKKVLLVDLDPQANATQHFVDEPDRERTVKRLFQTKSHTAIRQVIYPGGKDGLNLDVIPSHITLARTAEEAVSQVHREKILANHLSRIRDQYDYILIDCQPSLAVLTVNAIYAADQFIIPTGYGKYSLDGVGDLFDVISEVRETEDFPYKLLRSMKDPRTPKTNAAVEQVLDEYAGDTLFETIIHKSEAINQGALFSQTVFEFSPTSTGATDFRNLSKEIVHG